MMQVVLHRFPGAMVEYLFKCRTPNIDLGQFKAEIQKEIEHYCQLRFTEDELDYLKKFPFFKDDFVEFLRIFQPHSDYVEITEADGFGIVIKGPWLHTILFEVPLLAIVNEVYFRHMSNESDFEEGNRRLTDKLQLLKEYEQVENFHFSDFGTRRRYSKDWQSHVLTRLKEEVPHNLAGTSNVYFAKKFGMKPIGTMAHEYIQACQSLGPRLLYSQQFAFENWAQEYRGDLGIALSDTYGTDAFLRDFDMYFCKLFDGVRHDSGDPFQWAERIIAHYESMKVDPKTKTLVFSDSLTFPVALELWLRFSGKTKLAFGIGTNLMNDVGMKSIDIVIKMIECNGQPVAKISDVPGKTMCRDESYLKYLKEVFKISG